LERKEETQLYEHFILLKKKNSENFKKHFQYIYPSMRQFLTKYMLSKKKNYDILKCLTLESTLSAIAL